jgi:NhaP-type Na+/H+ or K+/H+ antiporter
MEYHLIYLTAVLGLGLAAQWLAWRFRLPAILLLLVFGFAAGQFADPEALIGPELLFSVVSLSVAVILFEGGLTLRIRELRETGLAVLRLVTVGILVTWILTAAAAKIVLGMETATAALVGAMLVVSGPTVIMPLLRQVRPVRRIGSVVKWEGIVNDPVGAVLAVLVFEAVLIGGFRQAALATLVGLAKTVVVATAIGTAGAIILVVMLRRFWIPDYLQNLAFLAAVVIAFALSNMAQPESGLVAVTLMGFILANQKQTTIRHVVEFKENLRVLLISCLFIVLASRIRLDDITGLGFGGLIFLAIMLLVVRPAAVFASTLGTELRMRERLFLAWIAPRGIVAAAVSSIFAAKLIDKSNLSPAMAESVGQIVPVTFLVIVGTVAVYGLTAGPVAGWLKVAASNPQGILFAGACPLAQAIARAIHEENYEVLLVDTSHPNIRAARMSGLPTVWANVLSEYVRDEIDFGGIGRLLALTPNDEVNALATQEFAQFFGRAEVYQLPMKKAESDRRESVSREHAGRLLFGADLTHPRLWRRFAAGAVVKKTPLTEEFDYRAFCDYYGPSATVLFLITRAGDLKVVTADETLEPEAGQKLISLVDPEETASSTLS